jgi:hypothetical protein
LLVSFLQKFLLNCLQASAFQRFGASKKLYLLTRDIDKLIKTKNDQAPNLIDLVLCKYDNTLNINYLD